MEIILQNIQAGKVQCSPEEERDSHCYREQAVGGEVNEEELM